MKRNLRDMVDSLIDRYSMACGEGGAVEHESDSIREIAKDFRVSKHRAVDVLQRLEKLARCEIIGVDSYYVDYLKKPQAHADNIKKNFQAPTRRRDSSIFDGRRRERVRLQPLRPRTPLALLPYRGSRPRSRQAGRRPGRLALRVLRKTVEGLDAGERRA